MKGEKTKKPVDSGYAWVILIATFGIYFLLAGSVKCIGILYIEFLDYYDTGAGHTAWIGSVCLFLITASGPFANCVVQLFSFRKVVLTGGVLVALGYLLSAFVPFMELMYLTIGVIAGIGYGLIFAPITTIINFYFEKKRSLAMGLTQSGSGIGSLVLPYFYRIIIDTYGVMGALLILSGFLANMCVFAALLREPPKEESETEHNGDEIFKDDEDENKSCSCFRKQNSIMKCSLFKKPSFTLLVLSMVSNAMGYASNFTVLPAHTKALGYNKNQVTLIFSLTGAIEIIVRPLIGIFVDKKVVSTESVLLFSYFASGVCALIIPFFPYLPALAVYSGSIGIFPGLYTMLMPVLLIDRVGLEQLSPAIGLAVFCLAFGAVISQPISGWLEDLTGVWDHSFQFIAACHFIAFFVFILEPFLTRFWCITSKKPKIDKIAMEICEDGENANHTEDLDENRRKLLDDKDSTEVTMTLLEKDCKEENHEDSNRVKLLANST